MAVTLSDIAKVVGVSHPVVSKVINGGRSNVRVGKDLAERIRQVAKEMGYRPHSAGRALRERRFNRIGVVIGTADESIFLPQAIIAGISRRLAERGYTASLVSTSDAGAQLADTPMLNVQQVDAVILSFADRPTPQAAASIRALKMPVVWLNDTLPTNSLSLDEAGAAAMLVRHMVGIGREDITFIDYSRSLAHRHTMDRLRGIREAAAGFDVSVEVFAPRVARPDRGDATRQWLKRIKPPHAVIVNSCTAAISILNAAKLAGWRIPEDLAVACFDDGTLYSVGEPTLTAAIAPLFHFGELAANVAIARAEKPDDAVPSQSISYELRVGASTSASPAASTAATPSSSTS